MKISINDPASHPLHHYVEVYLDGVKVEDCQEADEEKDEVTCLSYKDHAVIVSTVKGKVEIKLQPDTPEWIQREYYKLRGMESTL